MNLIIQQSGESIHEINVFLSSSFSSSFLKLQQRLTNAKQSQSDMDILFSIFTANTGEMKLHYLVLFSFQPVFAIFTAIRSPPLVQKLDGFVHFTYIVFMGYGSETLSTHEITAS